MYLTILPKLLWMFANITGDAFDIAKKNDSLTFIAIGDWGGLPVVPYTTLVQISVAAQMAKISNKYQMDFILALGDNFYFDGVIDVNDRRFNETFEEVYKYESLQIPWLVLAGNHDHNGNVSGQIAYSQKSNRWVFPDYFYTKTFMLPSKKRTMDIVMIDTVLLCGNINNDDPYIQPILLKKDKTTASKYWAWLENELKSSKADYLLVCGHYPVYSIASHGNTKCLEKNLVPLLEKYKVSAYLSGHDHNIQHIQVPNQKWQVEYFVSGAADFVDDSMKHINNIPEGSLKFHWGKLFSFGAFAFAEVTDANMTWSFLQGNGDMLYNYSFPPRFANINIHDML